MSIHWGWHECSLLSIIKTCLHSHNCLMNNPLPSPLFHLRYRQSISTCLHWDVFWCTYMGPIICMMCIVNTFVVVLSTRVTFKVQVAHSVQSPAQFSATWNSPLHFQLFMIDLCNIKRLGIKLHNHHFRNITRDHLKACVIKTLMPNVFALRDLIKNNALLASFSLNGGGLYQHDQYHKGLSF